MEKIARTSDEEFWFGKITTSEEFSSPFGTSDYALLLVVNREDISGREQTDLSERIVASGCRYAVCFGYECSTWDDSIDNAYFCSDLDFDPPDERFVMTTWHEDESIEEVVEYFRWNTVFDEFVPTKFLVLFVGQNEELEARTLASIALFFGAPPRRQL